jgi:hypothetical protein
MVGPVSPDQRIREHLLWLQMDGLGNGAELAGATDLTQPCIFTAVWTKCTHVCPPCPTPATNLLATGGQTVAGSRWEDFVIEQLLAAAPCQDLNK